MVLPGRAVGLGVIPAALIALAGAQAAANENLLPQVRAWAMPQAFIMERSFGRVDTCDQMQAAYEAGGWPSGVSLESLKAIDRRLKSRVFLRPDQGPDTWTPLAATVIRDDRKPAADCDDVAVTGAQLAVCAGFPAERLGLLVTQLPSRAGEMHVVAFYADPTDSLWVFGDTMGRPRPFAQLRQKALFYAYFDDVTKWWALRDPNTGEVLTQALPTASIPGGDEAAGQEGPLAVENGTCPLPQE